MLWIAQHSVTFISHLFKQCVQILCAAFLMSLILNLLIKEMTSVLLE